MLSYSFDGNLCYANPFRYSDILTATNTFYLILFGEIFAVYSDTNTKLVTTICGQNVQIWNVQVGGTNNYHCVLKGWIACNVKLTQTRMNFALGTFCEQPSFQNSSISAP
jgi:hypothetical protein